MFIYYHNNGAANYNPDVMAYNVRIQSNFPTLLKSNQTGVVKGTISWTDSSAKNTESVWDTAYMHAKSDVSLMYVPNSAVLHNGSSESEYSTNGVILSSEGLFGNGAMIAYDSRAWGVILGCNDYAGYVVCRIKVEEMGDEMGEEP